MLYHLKMDACKILKHEAFVSPSPGINYSVGAAYTEFKDGPNIDE